MQDYTIVGISTPVGVGAICIVRLSGKDALDITLKLAHRDSLTPRYATLSMVYDSQGKVIDEAILLYFKAPHSFNGEDICEIHCHGGVVCARMVVSSAITLGARIASNGEFSKRAFLNGKLDLAQVQAIASLINSQSAVANESLIHQMRGSLSVFVKNMRENLIEILAYSEANIDYSDDLDGDYTSVMQEKLQSIMHTLQHIYNQSKQREGFFEGLKLCIVGKPNVGKSSLLNALLGFERAIVSPLAGTTRDSVQDSLNIGGNIITLIDTAGIRQSLDNIEQIGIQRSLQALEQSNLALALFDSSKPLDSEDYKILEILTQKKQNILFVCNKCDLPCGLSAKDWEFLQACLEKISNKITPNILSISTKQDCTQNNNQVQKIIDCLAQFLESQSSVDFPLLSATYQIDKVRSVLDALQNAETTLQNGELEIFSFHINEALSALGDITHPFEYGELLDSLFSHFCLGK